MRRTMQSHLSLLEHRVSRNWKVKWLVFRKSNPSPTRDRSRGSLVLLPLGLGVFAGAVVLQYAQCLAHGRYRDVPSSHTWRRGHCSCGVLGHRCSCALQTLVFDATPRRYGSIPCNWHCDHHRARISAHGDHGPVGVRRSDASSAHSGHRPCTAGAMAGGAATLALVPQASPANGK